MERDLRLKAEMPGKESEDSSGPGRSGGILDSYATVVSADNLLWPVFKSFVEQWKALLEKKKEDVGQAPKLTKD